MRTHKLGEADLILVLLTREHGLVRAVAKGIRRVGSRFGAKLDRFCRVNVQIYPPRNATLSGGGLATVTDAATVATYAPQIVADVDRFYAGVAMLEIAEITVQGSVEEAGHVVDLLDASLADLAAGDTLPPRTTADRFVLQALGLAGWAPSLVDCAQCGRRGPHRAFHPLAGGAVCTTCRPRARSPRRRRLCGCCGCSPAPGGAAGRDGDPRVDRRLTGGTAPVVGRP